MSRPSEVTGQVATVADAIQRMEAIDASLSAHDGVACFNRMYLDVTRQVEQQIAQGTFGDPSFMSRLDVVFANLYFDAVDAPDAASTPVAWRPLFTRRSDPGIEPVQFALAGMNAHINRDLPVAVVGTCIELGSAPADGVHHADFQKVDALLDAAEQSIRQSFESGAALDIDRHVQAVENLICSWSINEARDIAWDTALALWEARDHPPARDLFLGVLGRTGAVVSSALLVPV